MNLANQISLINNSQDLMRLCIAALTADYGDDFLPIADDRADGGNDGYLKSEAKLFAVHCFKRLQNQSIENEILTKMMSDFRKALKLRSEGKWEIRSWTFLTNYPISEEIARKVIQLGEASSIEVSWRGPEYFADVLQRVVSVRYNFLI